MAETRIIGTNHHHEVAPISGDVQNPEFNLALVNALQRDTIAVAIPNSIENYIASIIC